MNYIIVDLEATCGNKYENIRNEIIEIGAVKINEQGQMIGEFNEFVKPVLNPVLTKFCTELTSIQQNDVDNAANFKTVLIDFLDWACNDNCIFLSWGNYDKNQFIKDCELHGMSSLWINKHINLKAMYSIKKQKKQCGMERALSFEGISLEGTHHRGIDDARNIAKIFVKYFGEWNFKGFINWRQK